ncbi:MAG TPA: NAD(P)-binding domain-containing protein, partial [Candidatus Eremiobacteraceae bacterium]|nr:NAD(P)-binding domain-containing protein [Candidatus Eremiobacteraceae bacterium]
MKIAILGSGDVGQSLAQGFLSRGHEVMMGSREPRSDRLEQWRAAAGPKASTGTFAEAARFAELAVLAVPWSAVASAIELSAPENLRGKIVIDVTNPLKSEEGKPPGLAVGHIDSAGETVARSLPGAKVVKAFNSVGHELMVDPKLPG